MFNGFLSSPKKEFARYTSQNPLRSSLSSINLNSSSSHSSSSLILSRENVTRTQVTSARAIKVSIKTAVWIVMCKHPAMREPASGCSSLYSERSAIKPGISASASSISFLPQAAREISLL
jgi:hypothetical protein